MHLSARVFLVFSIFLGAATFSPVASAEEELVDFNVKGSWVAEPELSQLGFIQTTFTFWDGGGFSQKSNFLSFCGINAIKPDCVYYWMVSEGQYSLKGNVIRLQIKKGTAVMLQEGQSDAVSNDMRVKPTTEEFRIGVDQGNLVITNKKGKAQIFMPVPATH